MSDHNVFHEGEVAIHERLGLAESMREKGGSMISGDTSLALQVFYHLQTFVFVGSIGRDGFPWASILCGQPGFMRSMNAKTLQIDARLPEGDPINDNIAVHSPLGTLAMEFDNRLRRGRINGVVEAREGSRVRLAVSQAYGNCSKYIQQRRAEASCSASPALLSRRAVLSAGQMERIARADTFFLSSYHLDDRSKPSHGVDVSHRGGAAGFVAVDDEAEIVFPDYRGNMAFNSLGNILKTPRAGLLFMDFTSGGTLQLTGEATLDWESPRLNDFPGASCLVRIKVREVVELADAFPYRWSYVKASPSNPKPELEPG